MNDSARSPGTGRWPLAGYRVWAATEVDEAREAMTGLYFPHTVAPVHRDARLDAVYHHATLQQLAIGFLS